MGIERVARFGPKRRLAVRVDEMTEVEDQARSRSLCHLFHDHLTPLGTSRRGRAATPYRDGSDRADRGTGADVHHADFAVALGEVDFLALDDGTGEGASDGADGGSGLGIDDADGTAFEFCCVCHAPIIPGTKAARQTGEKSCVITWSSWSRMPEQRNVYDTGPPSPLA